MLRGAGSLGPPDLLATKIAEKTLFQDVAKIQSNPLKIDYINYEYYCVSFS